MVPLKYEVFELCPIVRGSVLFRSVWLATEPVRSTPSMYRWTEVPFFVTATWCQAESVTVVVGARPGGLAETPVADYTRRARDGGRVRGVGRAAGCGRAGGAGEQRGSDNRRGAQTFCHRAYQCPSHTWNPSSGLTSPGVRL